MPFHNLTLRAFEVCTWFQYEYLAVWARLNQEKESDRMTDQEIEITLTAIDDASEVIDEASKKISADVDQVSASQKDVSDAVEQSSGSLRDFTVGASGAATAGFNFYNAIDRVHESEISLDRANLMVRSSTKSVEDAHRAVTWQLVCMAPAVRKPKKPRKP